MIRRHHSLTLRFGAADIDIGRKGWLEIVSFSELSDEQDHENEHAVYRSV